MLFRSANLDSKDGHAGYDTKYYGGIGYFEHDFRDDIKAGLGFAYLYNDTKFKDDYKSKSNMNTYRPFAYINYEHENWRFDLAVGWARHRVDNNRYYESGSTIYKADSKYDADEISGHLNVGYKFKLEDNVMLQPMVGLYAAKLKTDSYKEAGSGPMNLSVSSEDYNSLKSMLGVRAKKEYALENGGSFTPEMHLRWYHEMKDTNGGVSAYFLEQQELFNTNGAKMPRDIGDVAIRLTTNSGNDLDLFAEAYYQFGKDFYNAGGALGLQYNF